MSELRQDAQNVISIITMTDLNWEEIVAISVTINETAKRYKAKRKIAAKQTIKEGAQVITYGLKSSRLNNLSGIVTNIRRSKCTFVSDTLVGGDYAGYEIPNMPLHCLRLKDSIIAPRQILTPQANALMEYLSQ